MRKYFWYLVSGVILGNFLYQLFFGLNWGVAVERSYFQLAVAIMVDIFIIKKDKKNEQI